MRACFLIINGKWLNIIHTTLHNASTSHDSPTPTNPTLIRGLCCHLLQHCHDDTSSLFTLRRPSLASSATEDEASYRRREVKIDPSTRYGSSTPNRPMLDRRRHRMTTKPLITSSHPVRSGHSTASCFVAARLCRCCFVHPATGHIIMCHHVHFDQQLRLLAMESIMAAGADLHR